MSQDVDPEVSTLEQPLCFSKRSRITTSALAPTACYIDCISNTVPLLLSSLKHIFHTPLILIVIIKMLGNRKNVERKVIVDYVVSGLGVI